MDIEPLSRVAHALEDILLGVRGGAVVPPAGWKEIFAAIDAIDDVGARLREAAALDEDALAAAVVRLHALSASSGPPVAAAERESGAPPPPAPDGAPPRVPATAPVSIARLDELMARAGTLMMTVARAEGQWRGLGEALEQQGMGRGHAGPVARHARRLGNELHALEDLVGALVGDVRRARMLPLSHATFLLERVVHDAARARNKDVALELDDGGVELDRPIVEALTEILQHLARNAVDHGIEPPADREAAGKAPRGRITVRARVDGAVAHIEVADDGRGFDLDKLRAALKRAGREVPANRDALLRAAFESGLSTAGAVTEVSGRGIGLDVVGSRVASIRGAIEVVSEPGQGARFSIRAPVSLATARALLVRAGGTTFALPTADVDHVQRIVTAALPLVGGRRRLRTGDELVPVAFLLDLLFGARGDRHAPERPLVVVCASRSGRAAFVVDDVLDERELLLRPVPPRLKGLRPLAACALDRDGSSLFVLHTHALVARAALDVGIAVTPPAQVERKLRIVLADDSLTTRSLERSILEAAGYEVWPAADGEEAWAALEARGADAVVSDVEMPRLDGFGLTERIRGSARFRALPIVLVTGLARDEDRMRGLELGADAYVVKSGFDQERLLDTLVQLLGTGKEPS